VKLILRNFSKKTHKRIKILKSFKQKLTKKISCHLRYYINSFLYLQWICSIPIQWLNLNRAHDDSKKRENLHFFLLKLNLSFFQLFLFQFKNLFSFFINSYVTVNRLLQKIPLSKFAESEERSAEPRQRWSAILPSLSAPRRFYVRNNVGKSQRKWRLKRSDFYWLGKIYQFLKFVKLMEFFYFLYFQFLWNISKFLRFEK